MGASPEALKIPAPLPVILVEDRIEDVDHARSMLSAAGITEIVVFTNPTLAIEHLERGLQGDCLLPRGIVLDLILKLDNGFEVLRYCHSQPRLKNVPVVVWTALAGETERRIALWLGAKKYLTKHSGAQSVTKHLREVFADQSNAAAQ